MLVYTSDLSLLWWGYQYKSYFQPISSHHECDGGCFNDLLCGEAAEAGEINSDKAVRVIWVLLGKKKRNMVRLAIADDLSLGLLQP